MKSTTRATFLRLVLWFLVLCNVALIFGFSSQTGEQSAQTSERVTETVARLTVPGFAAMPLTEQRETLRTLQLPVRKMAHALEFALLGFLLMLAWAQYPIKRLKRMLFSLGMAALVALLDELYQRSVTGRGPSFTDIGIDILGAACGIMLFLVILRRRCKAL